MGALPKQRITRARQGFRRQHDTLKAPLLMVCPNCREMKQQHHVCLSCGFYAGRQVFEIEAKRPKAS
jgi:large subunit ribosomal protein L32